jgi:hypothetical protein
MLQAGLIGVRFPFGQEIFSSPQLSNWLKVPHSQCLQRALSSGIKLSMCERDRSPPSR